VQIASVRCPRIGITWWQNSSGPCWWRAETQGLQWCRNWWKVILFYREHAGFIRFYTSAWLLYQSLEPENSSDVCISPWYSLISRTDLLRDMRSKQSQFAELKTGWAPIFFQLLGSACRRCFLIKQKFNGRSTGESEGNIIINMI
jgi:hypothetical protein